ncbi:methyl-accepting chemotaxis protein [Rhodoplanes sp. TEM]|uniref:Methyl-accepting chemotaxis protein n=1 Tax=Rhodoplanes tepidamans TaxID=200616 RepID=A0ABT5J3P8_RHOTP|nr:MULTISPECIES: methyl-accepting chemotaxis protein [Rhodoplanes]MDC7784253.1 methyl-accepting chemotaxis protein [Rhodoplanes tepidamans]MDC7983645.1 methyl-accepting chemotaxis protein [Rhodoplanes sp. TEM]MDQ0353653.1 methyl-accepting chemotaxis protein [Rhodoplanes tepidamans]
MLAKLSIRAKIIVVVSFLLVGMTGMGLLAIVNMRTINAKTDEITQNWLPSVRALADLRAGVTIIRSVVRLHLLAETPEAKAAVEKTLALNYDRNAKYGAAYERLISSPEERSTFQEWKRQSALYDEGVKKVIEMSRANAGKLPTEVSAFNETKVYPIGKAADDLLNRNIALNNAGADAAARTAAATYDRAFGLLLIILGTSALAGIGLAVYLVVDVSRGIASVVTPMQALARGDLSAEVPHRGERNEIGHIADTLQVFKQALIEKKAADEAAAVEAEAKIERARRVDGITQAFEAMIGEIVETVSSASTELEASADTLSATARRSQSLTATVAGAAEDASSNVESVASATEEMSSSVQEISRQVQESARVAKGAVDQANTTNKQVEDLAEAANRIGDVVELINTIAGQTNLLALNATIEAARAGDAGKGFAVVAAEVKQLAQETAKATGVISQQITEIQGATQGSVAAIREIATTIGRLSEISSTIAAAVEQQGAATHEISRNVQQAAHGTREVSANIGDVRIGAQETGAAAAQVLSAAQSLSGDSTRLKTEVTKFLGAVRAA